MRARESVIVTAVLLFHGSAFAERAIILVNGVDFTLHTGGPGGQCIVTPLLDPESLDVSCSDSTGNAASANTVTGCLASSMRGLCASGDWGYETSASTQLNCGSGSSYNVTTGNTNGSCSTQGTGSGKTATCDDLQGNKAQASCDKGCNNEFKGGTGNCCKAGDDGCNPGH